MAPSRFLSSADDNATSPDCIVPNCDTICFFDACFHSPPPMVEPSPIPIHLHHPHDRLLPTLLITSAALLALAFLVLLSLYLFLRHRRSRRSRRSPPAPPTAEDPLGADRPGPADHHVWYIRTVGLEESTIRSIAAWVYKASDGIVDGSDCSVCLGEFADGELVRLLPKCSHAFHLSCIDTWLRSHVNCPLCRAPILAPAPAPADAGSESDPSDDSGAAQVAVQTGEMERAEEKEIESPAGPSSGLQSVQRSVSMDALSLGNLLLGKGEEEEEEEEGRVVKDFGKVGRISKAGVLVHKDPLGMESSLSSRSERYLLGRGRRNSVLPL